MSESVEEKVEEKQAVEAPRPRRESHSLFGPLVLIAIGVYFLLVNLSLLPDLYWQSALRLWPVLLIFLGVNLIVRQAGPPWGTVLSGLVAVAAIGFFAWVLLTGFGQPVNSRSPGAAVTREAISYPADDLSFAQVEIDFSSFPATVTALSDSDNLIEGTVTHRGELIFEPERNGDQVTVRLDTRSVSFFPFVWLNPTNWFTAEDGSGWNLQLNRNVPLDLRLDLSSGRAQLALSELTLDYLEIDGSSGSANVQLPPGEYEAHYDISSGSVTLSLPESGQQVIFIDGGSGSLTIQLPGSMEARIVVEDDGSGSFRPGSRFSRVGGGTGDEGTWQTAGFQDAADRVTITLDISSGSVSVR
ncbi:MAG TPA: DUF5668 domain-containing protein [Candidatus Sulfomarinibacteraceae bacterium]|nr:DUF5668 domain-containing protein [Candidatus Sulfomarinibacteraceae bacterium]